MSADIVTGQFRSNWGPRYTQIAANLDGETKKTMAITLADLFAPRDGAEEIDDPDAFVSDEEDRETAEADERRSMRFRILSLLGLGWLISNS